MQVGRIEVLETIPHDPEAYTQGLEMADGALYESTGRYGSSEVRRLDPRTGEVLARTSLADTLFGEGLTRVGDRLVQLTWQENVALVYDLPSLEPVRSLPVDTHGWGLCFDGEALLSTSGGSILFRRDPETLESLGTVQVTLDGTPLSSVNELECVGEHVYANVYQSTEIVRIDRESGRVDARWDAAALVPEALRGDPSAVLNGIARDPGADAFYVTGKLWPVMYRVRLLVP